MILGTEYLTDRGIDLDTASKLGIEIENPPSVSRIVERLGEDILIGGKPLSQVATTLIWFPCWNSDGIITTSWIARVLPTPNGGPKFLTPKGGSGPPFITKPVWDIATQTATPLIITEGPVKQMALVQAGYMAIGLNGVWCAHVTLPDGKRDLRVELKVFSLMGRKVYVCFDADGLANPMVRHATIWLFMLLSAAGAEVYQLTSWDLAESKGVDDLFVARKAADPSATPAEVMGELMWEAVPFVDTIRKTAVDLKAVQAELANVSLEKMHRHQLCKELARVLGVPMEELKKIGEPPPEPTSSWFVDVAPWDTRIDGLVLATSIEELFKKHLVLSPAGLVTAVLWVFMSYFIEVITTNPFLGVTSPEKRCGKTTMLEILYQLTRRPIHAANVSSAVVYRTIDKYCPTFLLDELDTFLHRKDELVGILNAGHRKGVVTLRCHPVTLEPVAFSGWCPKR
jgi:hypothetical protein